MEALGYKLQRLSEYLHLVKENKATLEHYHHYQKEIDAVTHEDLFILFKWLLDAKTEPERILVFLDKLIHVFTKSLSEKQVDLPKDSFLEHLVMENDALKHRLEEIKEILKKDISAIPYSALIEHFEGLKGFKVHYQKIHTILFPYLEKIAPQYQALSILWSLQNLTLKQLDTILLHLQDPTDTVVLNKLIGEYFFKAYGLIQKEELILFQITHALCPIDEIEAMREQSFEYGFFDIPTPLFRQAKQVYDEDAFFTSSTGHLSLDQLRLLLDYLPIDCTLVDKDNKVVYFNRPKDRIFPRSPSVIGRDVRHCHPADSVDVVDAIIQAFKDNKRDEARFWIEMRGKFLYIRYFALRDDAGMYQGTLEVSQEVSDIRALEGQRRLLQWDD